MDDPKSEIIEKLKQMAMKRCSERIEKAQQDRNSLGPPKEFAFERCEITSILKREHGL
jgi:hypothetical protein